MRTEPRQAQGRTEALEESVRQLNAQSDRIAQEALTAQNYERQYARRLVPMLEAELAAKDAENSRLRDNFDGLQASLDEAWRQVEELREKYEPQTEPPETDAPEVEPLTNGHAEVDAGVVQGARDDG